MASAINALAPLEDTVSENSGLPELKILLASDDRRSRSWIERVVDETYGDRASISVSEDSDDAIVALGASTLDACLVTDDFSNEGGAAFVSLARTINVKVPLILVSKTVPVDGNQEAIDAGADDLIGLDTLTPTLFEKVVDYALNRKQTEFRLRETNDELIRRMLKLREAKEDAEESERRYRILADNTPVGICHIDDDGRFVYLNAATRDLLELDDDHDGDGLKFDSHLDAADQERMLDGLEAWRRGDPEEVEIVFRNFDSLEEKHMIVTGAPLKEHGAHEGLLISMIDISERKLAESQIRHMAHHDALTGLPNRVLFQDRLEQAIIRANREANQFALMFLDLDHFKDINDTLGHPVGDALLQMVSERLTDCARETDTVARLGGDEFAIICGDLDDGGDIVELARRIITSIGTPFPIQSEIVHTATSVGITIYPSDCDELDKVIKFADLALYHAKENGRGTYYFFDSHMDEKVRERKELENDLRDAIMQAAFQLAFQPQVDLADGTLRGTEALVRWKHPDRGIVAPDQFIPLAEDTGLIRQIGEWVLVEACQRASTLRSEGVDLRVAVNLSAVQFKDKNLLAYVKGALNDSGLAADRLELEITESMVMDDMERAVDTMRQLSDIGITLAIDDFGTGFSSLSYLRKFPVDILKIDTSFVRDIFVDDEAKSIIKTIIALGRNLNLELVAEGIEEQAQADFLRDAGCDIGQGYMFGRPGPVEQLIRWQSGSV